MMFNSELSLAARHLVAFLTPVLVALVTAVTWPLFEANPITIYLVVVVISAWIGGFVLGILALLASFAPANFLFIQPYKALGAPAIDNSVRILTMWALVCELMQREKRRTEVNMQTAQSREARFLNKVACGMGAPGLGSNSYVRKPVDFGQFLEATKRLGLSWPVLNEASASE